MDFETVKVEQEGAVRCITLNRPESRNSINLQMRHDLRNALEAANVDDSVRVILLGGEGKGFCAGADLAEELPGSDKDGFVTEQIRNEYAPILNAITDSPKPVIAIVQGAAAGIGAAFAMACDLLIMSDNAFLYSAFGAIGLVPDGGAHQFFRNALGPKKAYEMIAFSQRLEAQECQQSGVANRVVPTESLWRTGFEMANELSSKAPLALRYSKQLLAEAANGDLKDIIDREAVLQNITLRSDDYREGTQAFFEKRVPQFKGC